MIRRYGEIRQNDRRYRRRPGAYAIIPQGHDVLLTHQNEPVPEFQLPGGGIDPGETPLRALYREVFEETGWHIAKPRRLGAFRRFTYMPEYDLWAEKLCHLFIARPIRAKGPPTEPGHTAVWTDWRTAVRILGNDGDRAFVRRLYGLGSPL